jgi:hypothetical protein
MKEDKNLTAGETASKMEETTSLKSLINTIVALLISVGASFKKVGGDFVTKNEVAKFFRTLFTLSNAGPYDTTVTVGGVIYPLNTFVVDTRIAAAFVMPKAVKMPGASPFLKDVSVHYKDMDIMSPSEMIEFQHKWFAMMKVQPTLVSIEEAIKPRLLGEITEVSNGSKCHVEDLASVKSIPVELAITDKLFGDEYFNYDIETVVKMVVVNFYTNLK